MFKPRVFRGLQHDPVSRKMRMKLNKSRQLLLVAAAGLLAASLVTACSQLTQTLTIDFVYVASPRAAGSNNYGEIDVFEINSESGKMRQIPTSPFPSQGRNPVALAVSVNYDSLFVVNQDDNTIVQFAIGDDGKLYPYNTVNTPGIFPMAVAASKSNLFVVDLYEPLPICSTAEPCSGSIGVYPLTAPTDHAPTGIVTPPVINTGVNDHYWPLTLSGANASHIIVPTAVNVLASGSYVYVTAYDSSVTPTVGYVFGFSVDTSGALTPLSGSPFAAGVKPTAITSGSLTSSSGTFVYVTDFANNNVLGYSVSTATATAGNLISLAGSPFRSGNQPTAIAVDTAFPFAYVTNAQDSTVTGYSISSAGALTQVGTYTTGLQPVAIGIDPSTEHWIYVLNFLGNNLSGFQLSETNGTLLNSQFSPFPTNANPTAAVAVPHNGTGAGIK